MPHPHYSQARASNRNFEPVQNNLFEVTVFTPLGDNTGLILQHVKNVDGLDDINPSIEAITQKYKQSDRSYAGVPSQTYADITVNFTLNLNDANENYIYNIFRNWYKLIYNPQTGEYGLKKDYIGSIIIVRYDRAGNIYRKLTLKSVFPTGRPDGMGNLDYENAEATELTITFRCDIYNEENVGA